MRLFLLAMAALLGSASALAYLPVTAAIGYPYTFNASYGVGYKNIPCLLAAYDRFGTNVKSWNIDESQFPMTLDNKGIIQSYVRPDDSFVTGENYTFIIMCGDQKDSQQVTFLSGGTPITSIAIFNVIDWAVGKPLDALMMLAGIILAVIIGSMVYQKVVKNR